MANLDEELENLQRNPERELDKMKSSPESKSEEPKGGAPNDAPNVGISSNKSEIDKSTNSPPEGAPNSGPNMQSSDKAEVNKANVKGEDKKSDKSTEHEEVYKALELILGTIISKLKLVFMMPYIFFKHYVKDFLSENETNEYKHRSIQPAVVSTVLVLVMQLGLSFLTKDYSMIKIVPVAVCLILCIMDSDKTQGKD